MAKKHVGWAKAINCALPPSDFKRVCQKWQRRLKGKFKDRRQFDTELLFAGLEYCEGNPERYAAELLDIRRQRKVQDVLYQQISIVSLRHGKKKPKPEPCRLAPKVTFELIKTFRSIDGSDVAVSERLAAYARVGLSIANGSVEPSKRPGEYLCGDGWAA